MQTNNDKPWKEQHIPVQSSHVDAMVNRIRDYGFINFYGEQRVGDAGHQNHVGVRSFDVGRAMLGEDFATAIDLIMDGRSDEVYNPSSEEVEAREVWRKTKDARLTLAKFPKNTSTMTRERDLIRGLVRYDNALEAIRCVHHNVRMFWIHAYQVRSIRYNSSFAKVSLTQNGLYYAQSFVWNRVATQRVKIYGLTPIIGDLYESNNDTCKDEMEVKVVSDPSSVDISQIILPLPGYNIQYPTNKMGELYETILAEDGIKLSKEKIPEATAKGSYRKLIQKAYDLKWEVVKSEGSSTNESNDDAIITDAKFTFELESGSYATMMLRELMVTTMSRDCKVKE
jgi:tRNA pseudouridine13 synthase